MEQENNRVAEFICVLGTNGTGKSTFLRNLIVPYMKNGNRVLILTPHPNEWLDVPELRYHSEMSKRQAYDAMRGFKSARRIVVDLMDPMKDLENVIEYYNDGMLIFDDCRAYFEAAVPRNLKYLQIARRQKMLDVVAVAHGFTEMPPVFFKFFTKLVLFKLREDPMKRKAELSGDLDLLIPIFNRVQEKSIEDPHYNEYYKRI